MGLRDIAVFALLGGVFVVWTLISRRKEAARKAEAEARRRRDDGD